MAEKYRKLMDALRQHKALNQWSRAAAHAEELSPRALRDLAGQARALMRPLTTVTQVADARLKGPRIGMDVIDTPKDCDWAWRPDAWRLPLSPRSHVGLRSGTHVGAGLKLFHDCPLAEMTLHQSRNFGPGSQAPFGIALDVLGFEGNFLSLVVDLPEKGRSTMTAAHILRATGQLQQERAAPCYMRLNVRNGPNTETSLAVLEPVDGVFTVEFDLAKTEIKPRRLEAIWLDIIFERPAMNRMSLGDVTLTRHPRAGF